MGQNNEEPTALPTPEEEKMTWIQAAPIPCQFPVFSGLAEEENIEKIAESLEEVEVPPDTRILVQEEKGVDAYVVAWGSGVNVIDEDLGLLLRTYQAGDNFGDLQLEQSKLNMHTVRTDTTTGAVMWRLSPKDVLSIVGRPAKKRAANILRLSGKFTTIESWTHWKRLHSPRGDNL
jgi:CRP-like cAMP-binding protein